MNATVSELGGVLRRLEALERQNRRLRRTVFALLLGAVAAVVLVVAWSGPGTLSAQDGGRKPEEVVLRDGQGKVRVRLAMSDNAAELGYFSEGGQPQTTLTLGQHGVVVRLLDEGTGRVRSGLSVEPGGVAIMTLDRQGRVVVANQALKADAGLLVPPAPPRTGQGTTPRPTP